MHIRDVRCLEECPNTKSVILKQHRNEEKKNPNSSNSSNASNFKMLRGLVSPEEIKSDNELQVAVHLENFNFAGRAGKKDTKSCI